jgi:imidazolonepropionase-like amidohydrolase
MSLRIFLRTAFVILLCTPLTPVLAQTLKAEEASANLAIVGGRLLDGWGAAPLEDSVILIRENRIVALGKRGEVAVPSHCRVIDASGMTVMPGLIDMHVHLDDVGHTDLNYPGSLYQRGRTRGIMAMMAKTLLMSGVTSARDLGAPLEEILDLRDKIDRGEIVGSRLFVSGPFLAKNVDANKAFDHWKVEGPEDARRKVRELVSRGVDWIKIVDTYLMSPVEVQAIVEEAHKGGKPVAAHAMYPEEIQYLLDAGFSKKDTFEHTGLLVKFPKFKEETVRTIVEKEIPIDPTIIVIEAFTQMEDYPGWKDDQEWKNSLPADIWQEVRASLEDYRKIWFYNLAKYERDGERSRLKQLLDSGAQMIMGSDSGARANPHNEAAWREMDLLEEIGMSPMQVLMASTRIPAQLLGAGDQLGTVEPGKKADILVIDGDPLASMIYLRHPKHIIKGGVVYK